MAAVNFVLSERTIGNGTLLLSVEGDTTAAAAGRLRQRLSQLSDKKRPLLIVDLSRVSFVDSGIVQALADSAGSLKRAGTRLLVVEPVDPMVARPLEIGRLDLVAEVVGTLGEAARRGNLPPEAVQPAIPAPEPAPESVTKARRTVFGRRRQDQDILQELGQLRRFAQELRREAGMHQQVAADEIERRRAAEEALLQMRESDARQAAAAGEENAGVEVVELEAARHQLEDARRSAHAARDEAGRMEAEAEEAHARIQQLEGELRSARTQIGTLRSELDTARAEADRMEAETEEAHARIQALEGDLVAARQAADAIRVEADTGRAATEETRSRIQALETDLARAQAEAESLRADLETARSESSAPSAAAADAGHARVEALEAETQELRAALEQARVDTTLAVEAQSVDAASAAEREAEEQRRREAEEAQRQAEQARLAAEDAQRRAQAEEEAARGPRPKVPVWADPTPIDLNKADVEDLMLLPGIGRRPAERILAFRQESGGFKSLDDLFGIREIPPERLKRIRPYVRV